jgi:hypothetical protein
MHTHVSNLRSLSVHEDYKIFGRICACVHVGTKSQLRALHLLHLAFLVHATLPAQMSVVCFEYIFIHHVCAWYVPTY